MSKIKFDWVEIPASEFLTGLKLEELESELCDPNDVYPQSYLDLERISGLNSVHLETFYIMRFPLTLDQADGFYEAHPDMSSKRIRSYRGYQGDKHQLHPEEVWYETALAIAEWADARLPTAPEWEKAARGTDGRKYPWGNEWDATRGNFIDSLDAPGRPEPEMKFPNTLKTRVNFGYPSGVSPYGVYDMAGNVREWTQTIVKHRFFGEVPIIKSNMVLQKAPPAESLRNLKVMMNNSWPSAGSSRISFNQVMPLDYFPIYTGMRLVKDNWDPTLWSGVDVSG